MVYTYISVAMNPVSSDRKRNSIKKQQQTETRKDKRYNLFSPCGISLTICPHPSHCLKRLTSQSLFYHPIAFGCFKQNMALGQKDSPMEYFASSSFLFQIQICLLCFHGTMLDVEGNKGKKRLKFETSKGLQEMSSHPLKPLATFARHLPF